MFRKQKACDLAICDFGLATAAHEEKYLFVRCGTPGFVAPQIINIRDMSTKSNPISDVFSAGLIFHQLLFGRSIFQGRRYQEILAENRACKFDFGKEMYMRVHPAALDLLKRMLEINPNLRISAQRALDHPFFALNVPNLFNDNHNSQMETQNPMPFNQINQNGSEMIDQKDQALSKYQKTTNISRHTSNLSNLSNLHPHRPQNYSNQTFDQKYKPTSIHSKKLTKLPSSTQKQNKQQYIPFCKKISFGVEQPDLILRRSKRNSMADKKYCNNMF